MPDDSLPLLNNHRLKHLSQLRIGSSIIDGQFVADCSMDNCNGSCCKDGVMVDPAERENILAHAEFIQRQMDPEQERDPEKWFEKEVYPRRVTAAIGIAQLRPDEVAWQKSGEHT